MAYADPQSVTIAGTAHSLPRTSNGENAGTFRTNDGLVTLTVSSSYGKRNRRVLRIEHKKISADPFVTTQNAEYSMTFYCVADVPKTGYTVAQQKEVIDGFLAWMSASSGAAITKILGGEN